MTAHDNAAPAHSERRLAGLLWGGAALVVMLAAPLLPFLARAVPACPFKSLTGIPCPFCGTTRAGLALARIEPLHAVVHYPLQSAAWIAFLAGGLWFGARAVAGRPLAALRISPRAWWAVAVLWAANWIYSIAHGV